MYDFSTPIDRHGTWCTQWDFVADRFGQADLLPFTISDMDFATAPCVLEALNQRIQHGVFGYSRWQHKDFLDAVYHWYQCRFSCSISTEQLVYAPSVIYLIAQLIRLWSDPGDSIVIHTPAYDAFYKVITANQRQWLPCQLKKSENSWSCDWQQLESLLAQKNTRILLLCSPHNPTGKVWSKTELQTMSTLCQRYNVKVISDEIHMDMTWQQHTPWSQVALSEWALATSASKSFNIPALTGAYGFISDVKARDHYLQQLKNSDGLSSPAVLSLVAHVAAYQQGEDWLDALRHYLKQNMNYVAEQLNRAFPTLNWQPPQATYLAWLDFRSLYIDEQLLQHTLIHQEKVAIMAGSTYGEEGRGFLRLNVGCPRQKVELGVKAIINAINSILSSG